MAQNLVEFVKKSDKLDQQSFSQILERKRHDNFPSKIFTQPPLSFEGHRRHVRRHDPDAALLRFPKRRRNSTSITGTLISAKHTLADFTTATGIEAKMDLFADNDELFAKLKGGNPGYDVIVPTNDMLERMIKAEHGDPAGSFENSQHGQHRQAIPGRGIRSGPQAFDTLHVGHLGRRLPQVKN